MMGNASSENVLMRDNNLHVPDWAAELVDTSNNEEIYLIVQAAGAAALCLLTAALVYFTAKMVSEMKKSREANVRPNVIVTMAPAVWSLKHTEMHIKNIGSGGAYNISVSCEQNPTVDKGKKLNDLSYSSIAFLAPGEEFTSYLGEWQGIGKKKLSFAVQCKDVDGRSVNCKNEYNGSHIEDMVTLGGNIKVETLREVEKVRKELKNISIALSKH